MGTRKVEDRGNRILSLDAYDDGPELSCQIDICVQVPLRFGIDSLRRFARRLT